MRLRLAVTLAASVVALLAAPAAASASSFSVTCASSHVANDDPIVFAGQPGAAHRHEFFGATTTRASSTTASLERSPTTCADPADTAAYWVPTLEVHGTLVRGTMRAYYERAGKARAAAPPRGLRMVAGDPHATVPQPLATTSWQCVGQGRARQSSTVPTCRRGERLAAWVRFPDCWDGRRLDAPDHRSHMAYALRGRCGADHPVELMRIALLVTWPVHPARADTVRLAGGMLASTGMHGDVWNSWQQPALRQLRWDCIEVAAPCGDLNGPPS
ncbi:MAG: hypothetical protein JWM98_797 [Thermoleophilia bacterium]|nr:hypothetical protein [Thermoleophilia bacterium]